MYATPQKLRILLDSKLLHTVYLLNHNRRKESVQIRLQDGGMVEPCSSIVRDMMGAGPQPLSKMPDAFENGRMVFRRSSSTPVGFTLVPFVNCW